MSSLLERDRQDSSGPMYGALATAYVADGWLAIKEVPGSERQNFMFK